MGLFVYGLCALTSLICAALLFRGFRLSGSRLLFWASLCFAFFCLNNILLIVDVSVLPDRDLSVIRSLPALVGISLLIYGLIWESAR